MAEVKIKINEKLMKRIKEHLAPKEISVEEFIVHSIESTLDSEEKDLGELLDPN